MLLPAPAVPPERAFPSLEELWCCRCSFRFANEKLGQMSRKLLKDTFSNLALSAWVRHSAHTASPALPFTRTLHGAGGDKKGGLWGQHRGCRSGCPTWCASHITGVMLIGRRRTPNPQSPRPKHNLWLLELMGDSRLLLPQEIAQMFFGNYQCPGLPSGILSAAPQQPGCRNAQGLQLEVGCRADPWPCCWLSPSWAVVLGMVWLF